MTKDINLVPQEVKKKQAKKKIIRKTTLIAIGITLLFIGFSTYLFLKKKSLTDSIFTLEQKIESLRDDIVQMKDIEVKVRRLDKQYIAVKTLLENKIAYSRLLDELDKRKPDGILIDTFNTSGKDEINISGKASNYLLISDFVGNLSNSNFSGGNSSLKGLFKNVTLNSVNLDSQSNKVRFFIVVKLNFNLLQLKQLEEAKNGN